VNPDQVATGAWRARTRAIGSEKAAAASDRGCRDGSQGEATSDSGDVPRTRDVVCKYPCGVCLDSAAHGSQPGRGAGR
jgi:hypothetical protein